MTAHAQFPGLPERATWPRVIADQKKVEVIALGMMIFCLWFRQVGPWSLPISLAAGVLLGLLNHLVTEYWLLRTITRGDAPTKAQLRRSTMLRLAVTGGGCSGYSYNFALDDARLADDLLVEEAGARILIDPVSLDFLAGAEIDFTDDLMGQSFKVNNPNATSSCGCGTSFSV